MKSRLQEFKPMRAWATAVLLGCSLLVGAGLAQLSGCSRSAPEPTPDESPKPETKPSQRVHFPQTLRVQDHSVNKLVEKAMSACAEGDYDTFRLLWTAREEPLPRGEFDHGWEAVTLIEVLALEPIKIAPPGDGQVDQPTDAYAIMANVQLDPNSRPGAQEPHRTAISVIVKENEEWKLANAPKAVRRWLREKVSPASTDAPPTIAPPESPATSP